MIEKTKFTFHIRFQFDVHIVIEHIAIKFAITNLIILDLPV